jgi:hypothetical protein
VLILMVIRLVRGVHSKDLARLSRALSGRALYVGELFDGNISKRGRVVQMRRESHHKRVSRRDVIGCESSRVPFRRRINSRTTQVYCAEAILKAISQSARAS